MKSLNEQSRVRARLNHSYLSQPNVDHRARSYRSITGLFNKAARVAALAVLAIVYFAADAKAQSGITVASLAGPWQIALIGNTGCGQTSMLFSGTLNTSGTATGTVTSASGCGPSSSTQTFTINSLNSQGSGTAGLSCGSGCGWSFNIEVAANEQSFNLVDVSNGGSNVLAGAGVAKVVSGPAITLAKLAGPWQIALAGDSGCGRTSMLFTGTLNASGTATGTLKGASGCGTSNSTQTFTINSLNAQGSGTAGLSCGSGCGWSFNIQVAANAQTFNLVDVSNGSSNLFAGTAIAKVGPVTLASLAGPWQIALVGNTGCGASSMLFTGTLNASGTATGTLKGASGCGTSSSTQTFTISSLNSKGSGVAGLSCGSGCGWTFNIQVAPNAQTFNLVDVSNGSNNVLAGYAASQNPPIVQGNHDINFDVTPTGAAIANNTVINNTYSAWNVTFQSEPCPSNVPNCTATTSSAFAVADTVFANSQPNVVSTLGGTALLEMQWGAVQANFTGGAQSVSISVLEECIGQDLACLGGVPANERAFLAAYDSNGNQLAYMYATGSFNTRQTLTVNAPSGMRIAFVQFTVPYDSANQGKNQLAGAFDDLAVTF